jgi:glycosyltransferase involved in cell wall biosynthesis
VALLIVFSEELREHFLEERGWPRDRVVTIPHRVDIPETPSRLEDSLAREYGLPPGRPRVMLVSRLMAEKSNAVRTLFECAPAVATAAPDVEIIIVGGGSDLESLRREGATLNARLGRKVIRFLGPVPEARRLLPAADVVLGVGRSVFEAMAIGKPSLVVGERGYAGVVQADTVSRIAHYNFSGRNLGIGEPEESLADVLGRLLRDRGERDRLGEFARAYVETKLDVGIGARKIERLYAGLAGGGRGESRSRVLAHTTKLAGFYLVQGLWRRLRYRD